MKSKEKMEALKLPLLIKGGIYGTNKKGRKFYNF